MKKQVIISTIVKQCYNERQQKLSIYNTKNIWPDVLRSQNWESLKSLNLGLCKIFDQDIKIVLDYDWSSLMCLDLWDNNITIDGVRQIVKKVWPKLEQLSLNSNKIGDEGFSLLITNLPHKITNLKLYNCSITHRGLKSIIDCHTDNLKQLDLSYNMLGNTGGKLMSKFKLSNLEILKIIDCQIGYEGFKHTTKSLWNSLLELHISNRPSPKMNTIQLTNYQCISTSGYKNLRQLVISEQQPIGYLSLILMEACPNINKYSINIDNKQLRKEIDSIFINRQFYK